MSVAVEIRDRRSPRSDSEGPDGGELELAVAVPVEQRDVARPPR
jgi:hypothetical protein